MMINFRNNYFNFKHLFNSRNIIWSIFLLFVVLGTGCGNKQNSKLFKNDQKITLQVPDGMYVCADNHQQDILVANRRSAKDWEIFTVHLIENNRIALRASNYHYVEFDDSQGQLLKAVNSELTKHTMFEVIQVDSVSYIFRTVNNLYVGIDESGILHANREYKNEATVFKLKEAHKKSFSWFTQQQLMPLITGLLLLFAGLILFHIPGYQKWSVMLLVAGGLAARFFIALLDGHLEIWDEQFHALVAKNMMDHPFKPMLYLNPVLPYDPFDWVGGHVWLHKQPLFLWQMALSMELFGVNTLAARLPSILMSTAVIWLIYRVGSIIINREAGFYGAFFFALSNFALELTAGAIHTDHNDIAFLFYVSASLWSWIEYERATGRRKKMFMVLTGVLAGCAVLVKWLMGLVVFTGWGLSIILHNERRKELVHYVNIAISFFIGLLIFVPWQIYIHYTFPEISQHEQMLVTSHLFTVVEGHGGNAWFHFDMAQKLYGVNSWIVLASIVLLMISVREKFLRIALITVVVLVYGLYTFAATKMIAFTFCIAMITFLALGTFIWKFFKVLIINPVVFKNIRYHFIFPVLVITILSVFNLDIEKIQYRHTLWKKPSGHYLETRKQSVALFKDLNKQIKEIKEYVFFNSKSEDVVPLMFFTDVVAAYSVIPYEEQVQIVRSAGWRIAIFDNGNLPPHLMNDDAILKVKGYW